MSLLDDIESEATPTVAHAEVCVDGRLLADYLEVRSKVQTYKAATSMLEDAEVERLTEQFAELHQRVVDKTRCYTFVCMDRVEREKLKDQHPPTDKQRKQLRFDHNPATFEPVLAGHCLIEIDGKPVTDDVERRVKHFDALYRTLPQGEHGWGVVAKALSDANYEGTQVPKYARDIAGRLVSELNSTTQPDTE